MVVGSVSYTHLDVYKRQAYIRSVRESADYSLWDAITARKDFAISFRCMSAGRKTEAKSR